MTILEAGIIAGGSAGAAIGGVLGSSHGILAIVGFAAAGMMAGAVGGWLFAIVLIGFLAGVGVLWRAARGRADVPPSELEIKEMTPVAIGGTFFSAVLGLGVLIGSGWLLAVLGVIVSAFCTALAAVARCELRRAE